MVLPPHTEAILQGKAHRVLRECAMKTLDEFELSMQEWTLLALLAENAETAHASTLGLTGEQFLVLAQALVAKGLLEAFEGPTGQPVLTNQGNGTVSVLNSLMHANMVALLDGVSEDDLHAYFRVLEGIIKNAPQN